MNIHRTTARPERPGPGQTLEQAVAADACTARGDMPDQLLEILHAVQGELGYLPRAVLPEIAARLNISLAEIHGVVTFYHDFRFEPAPQHVLKICRAEACQSVGCETLVAHLARRHGIEVGAAAAGGSLTVEEVYCLGNCALSPAALYDGRPIGRLSEAVLDRLVEEARTSGKLEASA